MKSRLGFIASAIALLMVFVLALVVLFVWLPHRATLNSVAQDDPANTYQESTFYLDMVEGCYSIDAEGSPAVPVATVGANGGLKSFFSVPCSQMHHFEVIYAGDVTPSEGTVVSSTDVGTVCNDAYTQIFGKLPPTKLGVVDAWYLAWFFADPGSEFAKFQNKAICAISKPDTQGKNYLAVTGSA